MLSKKISRSSRLLLIIILLIYLQACFDNKKTAREFVAEIKSQPPTKIEPLALKEIPVVVSYQGYDFRDPFMPAGMESVAVADIGKYNQGNKRVVDLRYAPDMQRRREPLESHTLESLSLVGTLQRATGVWGLVRDSDGSIHTVRIGNYLGTNHGKITSITDNEVILEERIQDEFGSWSKRRSKLAIQSE